MNTRVGRCLSASKSGHSNTHAACSSCVWHRHAAADTWPKGQVANWSVVGAVLRAQSGMLHHVQQPDRGVFSAEFRGLSIGILVLMTSIEIGRASCRERVWI